MFNQKKLNRPKTISLNCPFKCKLIVVFTSPLENYGADLDPGSGIRDLGSEIWDSGFGAFLTPGSGARNRFFRSLDPGSQIPNHIIESLMTKLLSKKDLHYFVN